jgi:translation initiation factor 1 (eIF-1/SUI1)
MKTKTKKKLKKSIRLAIGIVMLPFAILVVPIYKWYRKVRYQKETKGKVRDIITGFSYLLVKDTDIEVLAKKRAAACGTCKHAKYDGTMNTIIVGETVHQIKGMKCNLCGCSLSGKVRGENESCPIWKW